MIFGSYFGKRNIISLMVEHSIATKVYSERQREIIKKYGHLIFKLFGYPLNVSARQKARAVMKYLIRRSKGGIMLDAGCGMGLYSFELASRFDFACDIDIDFEDIKLGSQIAQETNIPNIAFSTSDVTNLPFIGEMFDVVLSLDVISYVCNDDKLIQEVARVLKPNGILILSTFYTDNMEEYTEQKSKIYNYNKELEINGGPVRNGYSLKKLHEILNNSGLKITNYTYTVKTFHYNFGGPILFPFMYLFSIIDNILPKKGKGIIIKAVKENSF